MKISVLLLLSAIGFHLPVDAAEKCGELLEQKLATDLSLGYKEFDQTMESGWRTLVPHQCYKEAALLLQSYIQQNESKERSLKWHLFQMNAYSGDYEDALNLTNSLLTIEEKAKSEKFQWNEYVLANVAFLKNDLEKLKLHRDKIAAKKDQHFGNELNLVIVDNLINSFGKPYRLAYEGK